MNKEESIMCMQSENWEIKKLYDMLGQHLTAPSVIYKPNISIDGNEYCVLYGKNLHDGIAGFGKTAELAMIDFDKNWNEEIK